MPKEHDFVAMRLLVDLLADKWTLPVLAALCANGGRLRFNALRRAVSDVSQKSLSSCLKRLEACGLIDRIVAANGQLCVEYQVTAIGHSLELPILALMAWSNQHIEAIQAFRATDRPKSNA